MSKTGAILVHALMKIMGGWGAKSVTHLVLLLLDAHISPEGPKLKKLKTYPETAHERV